MTTLRGRIHDGNDKPAVESNKHTRSPHREVDGIDVLHARGLRQRSAVQLIVSQRSSKQVP